MVQDAKVVSKGMTKLSGISGRQKAIINWYEELIESWINLDPTLEEYNPELIEKIRTKTAELEEYIKAELPED
jgi:hypothetical protein